jgi:hypothetical protein
MVALADDFALKMRPSVTDALIIHRSKAHPRLMSGPAFLREKTTNRRTE